MSLGWGWGEGWGQGSLLHPTLGGVRVDVVILTTATLTTATLTTAHACAVCVLMWLLMYWKRMSRSSLGILSAWLGLGGRGQGQLGVRVRS